MAEFTKVIDGKIVHFVTADEEPYEFDYLDTTIKCPKCGHEIDPDSPND